jgi:AAA+ superfamily predicted ATPase
MTNQNNQELFEQSISCPDITLRERFASLVGIDDQKARVVAMLRILVNPDGLTTWSQKYHPDANNLLSYVLKRPPLLILAGDVGSGKTELAQTVGDEVARKEKITITVFPLSLASRGQGRVGEMTQLLSSAFEFTISEAAKLKSNNSQSRGAVILLVDEADSLAQSREAAQMHHEDRAGVNAFIRGIDQIANSRVPAAVIMCTNRPGAIDPAVKRRAADILFFGRPSVEMRRKLLSSIFQDVGFSAPQIEHLVDATGPKDARDYGLTFSDLTQRLIPSVVLDAYPGHAIKPERAIEIALSIIPTPPFQEYGKA